MLLQQQRNQLADQDAALGKISNVIDVINYENEEFSTEVKHQNKLLTNLNDDMDKVADDMVKVDTRLKRLMTKGSTCCLWIILLAELGLGGFLVSLL